jgi:dihydrolipoamide dehydrogenase
MYDLIVIGGGPAGYHTAELAGREGLAVLLIEKEKVGGVCLNEGCIPSKSLLYCAKLYDTLKHGKDYGITADSIAFSHESVLARKDRAVRILAAGVKSRLTAHNVTVVESEAEILPRSAQGFRVRAGDGVYEGKRLLIATGSIPVLPPIPGLREGMDSGFVLTNREILSLGRVPEALVVIGGGIVGLEMASYYRSAGSKVTVVEMLDHIAGNTDREISELLMKEYAKKGVTFRLNARVSEITDGVVFCESEGRSFQIPADKVLVSAGRKPATAGLGLEAVGIELDGGAIRTDNRCRTNVPEVYAAGDVNGISMLAHTAYREAEACVNTIMGRHDVMRYNAIPSVIYTNPEVGSVGETEESAAEKGLDYVVKKLPLSYSGRFVAENRGGTGLCKIIADKDSGRLLGVHIIGSYASEMIFGASMMLEMEMRVEDVRQLVFPHPTVSEIIRETAFEF